MKTIYFAKMHKDAKIPTKRDEDAGRDVYACFDEDYMEIPSGMTTLVPTKICSAFDKKYYAQFEERGSTGTKAMVQHCGVMDSGYRGEWMVPIGNYTGRPMYISKLENSELKACLNMCGKSITGAIVYPYSKAICQAVFHIVPELKEEEISYEELMSMESERMDGKIGSSGK